VVEAVRALTWGEGADAALECAGRPETLRMALKSVRPGGFVAAVGENREVTLHIGEDLIRPDLTLFGSWYYHFCEYPALLQAYRQGLQAERLVTHRFPLEEAPEAYHRFAAGETAKTVLLYP
jgi:propanol-preferring alcohol dehydrogenase